QAFEMPLPTDDMACDKDIFLASLASLSATKILPDKTMSTFTHGFRSRYNSFRPHSLFMWAKAATLMQTRKEDMGLAVIWTTASDPQLCVLDKPLVGAALVVTPSSYLEETGKGWFCLLG